VEPATLARFGLMESERRRVAPALPMRVVAGIAAGVLVLLAGELLGPTPPVSSLAAGAVVAVAVALLPRLAWLAAAAALLVWLGSNDEVGTAVVIGVAIAPTPLLLMWGGTLWSLPALAPALGAIGLAPAYAALAALAPTPWRRAGLGAAGYFWLVGAEVLTGNTLLYGPANGVHARATWHDSFSGAVEHAVVPTLTSAVLLPAVVFAAFSAALPLLVRGRPLAIELILGGAWAVGFVVALEAMGRLMDGAAARGAVLGPLVGLAVAIVELRAAPRALTESP